MMIQRLGRLDEAATMLARVAADPSAEAGITGQLPPTSRRCGST